MDSAKLKERMLWYLLIKNYNLLAVTEYGGVGSEGIADVFAVGWNHFSHEYEIKVARSDLMGELKTVKLLCDRTSLFHEGKKSYLDEIRTFSKLDKHSRYLQRVPPGEEMGYRMFGKPVDFSTIPNKFSFAVTPDLRALAKECLAGTPYGLVVVAGDYEVSVVKKAEWLHREKISNDTMEKVAHKTSTELYGVRRDLGIEKANYQNAIKSKHESLIS